MEITFYEVTQAKLETYETKRYEYEVEAGKLKSNAYFNRITLLSASEAEIIADDFNGDMQDLAPWEVRQAAEELSVWISDSREVPDPVPFSVTFNAVTQRKLEEYELRLLEFVQEAKELKSAAYINRVTITAAVGCDIAPEEYNGALSEQPPWKVLYIAQKLRDWIAACKEPPDPS